MAEGFIIKRNGGEIKLPTVYKNSIYPTSEIGKNGDLYYRGSNITLTEREYLETNNNNNGYFVLNYLPNDKTTIKGKIYVNKTQSTSKWEYLYGLAQSGWINYTFSTTITNGTKQFCIYAADSSDSGHYSSGSALGNSELLYDKIIEFEAKPDHITILDEEKNILINQSDNRYNYQGINFTQIFDFGIFCALQTRNGTSGAPSYTVYGNKAKSRIYFLEIYEENCLIHKLIPCSYLENSNIIPALYDEIQQKLLYRNGNFVLGPAIQENNEDKIINGFNTKAIYQKVNDVWQEI